MQIRNLYVLLFVVVVVLFWAICLFFCFFNHLYYPNTEYFSWGVVTCT